MAFMPEERTFCTTRRLYIYYGCLLCRAKDSNLLQVVCRCVQCTHSVHQPMFKCSVVTTHATKHAHGISSTHASWLQERPARVVNVSSSMANTCVLDMADPQLAKPGAWSGVRAYSQSKLCQVCKGVHATPLLSLCNPCLQLKRANSMFVRLSCSFCPALPQHCHCMYDNMQDMVQFGAACTRVYYNDSPGT